MKQIDFNRINEVNLQGMVWAMPTDTIPGFSCLALDQQAVNRMDTVKKRTPDKSYIVMIGSVEQLELFNISLSPQREKLLNRLWPGPVSVVIPGLGEEFSHLDGVIEGLVFRLPDNQVLRDLCLHHGPMITTSANISGEPALRTIDEIASEFGKTIDYIVTDTWSVGEPSSLIKVLR